MIAKIQSKKIDHLAPEVYLSLDKMTIEEADTIRASLAVLTEQEAEKFGIPWNREGTREKLLLSFIGIVERMEEFKNEQETLAE